MPPKKARQTNTLRAWAGIKSPTKKPVFDSRLVLRIDPQRWRAMIAKSYAGKFVEPVKPKKTFKPEPHRKPHPFFQQSFGQKSVGVETDKEVRANEPIVQSVIREPHAFFKKAIATDRPISKRIAYDLQLLSSLPKLKDAPQPSRADMHVVSQSEEKLAAFSQSTSRKRKRSKLEPEATVFAFAFSPDSDARVECARCNSCGYNFELVSQNGASTVPRAVAPKNGSEDEASMLSARYAPEHADQILGNERQVHCLRSWLQSRRLSNRSRLKLATRLHDEQGADDLDDWIVESDDEEVVPCTDDAEPFSQQEAHALSVPPLPPGAEDIWQSNVVVLGGPPGSGKSATIRALCDELHYEIFEVHAGMKRSHKDIKDAVGEIAQSHLLNQSNDGKAGALCVLLFEDVDVIFAEDKEFWTGIFALIATARRPLLLTCNDVSLLPRPLADKKVLLHFDVPPVEQVAAHVSTISKWQGFVAPEVTPAMTSATLVRHDLRASLAQLQLDRNYIRHAQTEVVSLKSSSSSLGATQIRLAIAQVSEMASLADILLQQTRSRFVEEDIVFESENEEITRARASLIDDLSGHPIVSEPAGRYQGLWHGDNDPMCGLQSHFQGASLPDRWYNIEHDCPLHHDKNAAQSGQPAVKIRAACQNILDPEPRSPDHLCAPMTWQRSTLIVCAELGPFVNILTQCEMQQEHMEQLYTQQHGGRLTRNTVLSATGIKRKRKFNAHQLEHARTLQALTGPSIASSVVDETESDSLEF